nr:MAG TPA: hypothetical protein [Herelleviridae sp.]
MQYFIPFVFLSHTECFPHKYSLFRILRPVHAVLPRPSIFTP